MRTIGIDPGKEGAIVVLEDLDVLYQRRADGPDGYHRHGPGEEADAVAMATELLRAACDEVPGLVVVEAPHWHAGKGRRMNAGTAGRLGIEHGAWRGALAGLGWPFLVLEAVRWRPMAGIRFTDRFNVKAPTVDHVEGLLPGLDLRPGRKVTDHDGLADAAGMALAARAYLRRASRPS